MNNINLSDGSIVLVDDEDYEKLNQHNWINYNGYAGRRLPSINGERPLALMHREIMQPEPEMEIDHIDGNTLNNTKSNLRVVTHSQNLFNRGKPITNTSGYKGVHWDKSEQKWRAIITIHRKRISLGRFSNLEQAAKAYDEAAIKFVGPTAKLNFPKP